MMYTTMEEVCRWEVKDLPSKLAASAGTYFAEVSHKFSLGKNEGKGELQLNWLLILGCSKGRTGRDKPQVQVFLNGPNDSIIDKELFHLCVEINDYRNVVIQGSPRSKLARGKGDVEYEWNDILQFVKEESFDMEFFRGSMIITLMLKKTAAVSIGRTLNATAIGDICEKEINKEKPYRMIAKLENDEKNSDVKIISGDGQEFYAYRWILSEASDVFEAMFRSDMTEKETGVVKLEDLSGATVKLLLHFIYTQNIGQESSTPGILEEFVYAADKYQIEDLKEFLDANLGKVCTAENAGNLVILAEKTSMKKAEADILVFIKEQCNDTKGFVEILKNTKI